MFKRFLSTKTEWIKACWHQLLNSPEPALVLMRLMVAGVLLRFLVMPFFCHPDFLSEYRRIHLQVVELNIFPGARFIVTLVEMLNYAFASIFLPDASSMFYIPPDGIATAGHQDFFIFVAHPSVFRTLFLLKLGYLVFDISCAWIIFRYTLRAYDLRKATAATAVWIFNPITIFSFYIFGRYESIALFFFLLSLLWMRENRLILACSAFALSLWSREIFALVLPLFLLAVWTQQGAKLSTRLLGTAILTLTLGFVSNILPAKLGFTSVLTGAYNNIAAQSQIEQIIAFNIKWYYPIIVIYTLLAFYLLTASETVETKLPKAIFGFFLSFFIFSIHSVHYVAWLFPVLCLFVPKSRHMILAVIGFELSWFFYWLVATDLGVFTAWLAAPVSTHLLNLPNIPVWLGQIMPQYTSLQVGELVAIFKSINIACLIYMAVLLFQKPILPAFQNKEEGLG